MAQNKPNSNLQQQVFKRFRVLCVCKKEGVKVLGTYETKSKLFESACNKEDKDNFEHPTIKPLSIIETLISNSVAREREREREWCLIHSLVVEQVALLQSI